MGREDVRQYWEEQLSEYWSSGFSIPEYCELKDLAYESARRWVRIFSKERETSTGPDKEEPLELIEVDFFIQALKRQILKKLMSQIL